MKKLLLIASMIIASANCAAEVNIYPVKFSNEIVALGDEITLPAVITGRVEAAGTPYLISFQTAEYYQQQPAAVYVNTGTGAVFKALLYIGEEGYVDISTSKTLSFSSSTPYVLSVSASTYEDGASYAVCLGDIGDFNVSFDGNGGSVSTNSVTYTPGGVYGKFPTATMDGYELTGWSTAATNGIVVSTNTQVCVGYKTLYAQWELDPTSPTVTSNETTTVTNYHVAFNSNGGSGTMSNQTFTVDVGQALSTNLFTKSGYEFRGWATSLEGSVVYEDGAVVTNLTEVGSTNTLYASWIISSDAISSQVVNGVTWHYSATNGVAVIQNVSNGTYVAAVDTTVKGRLEIPEKLGTNVVEKIGERAFYGCSSVTNIIIPYGVTTIGSYAFSCCTNLAPGIIIPDSVDTMGAYVFEDCMKLRVVYYQGDCPDVDEELYRDSPSSLRSGILRVRDGWVEEELTSDTDYDSSDADDSDGDASDDTGDVSTVSSVMVPARWPDGDYSRGANWWVAQPLHRVIFWQIPGKSSTVTIQYYVPGRVLGTLPDDPEREGNEFLGWFTKPYGGTKVTDDVAEEMIVNSSFSIYAHWQSDDEDAYETLEDVEYSFKSKHVYDGYLLDGDGNMAGTIELKTSKGKWNRTEEETNVTATAKIVLLGEGSIKLKGTLDEDVSGTLVPTASSDERELSVELSGSAMEGTFEDYTVHGTRDIFGRKTYLDYTKAQAVDDDWKGYYVAVFQASSDSALGNGYVGLSIQVKSKGKARVTGILPDGTKVAYTGQMEVTDDGCYLPVVLQLYSGKKGGFGFLVEFPNDSDVAASSVSDWKCTTVPFTASLELEGIDKVRSVSSDATFAIGDSFSIDSVEVDESLLPEDVEIAVSGTKWSAPRSDRVKFIAEDEAYEVLTDYGNTAGLSLSYTAKSGTFRGRFKVFAVTESGKSKKYSATVTGAVLDGVGYGSATIKKVGAVPVTVTPE